MWPEIPVQTKVRIMPYLLLVAVGLGVLADAGALPRPATAAGTTKRPGSLHVRQPAPTNVARADIPARYLRLYQQAGRSSGVAWPVLAAVGKVESGHGRHMGPSSAGALGPMQFMPGTWKTWGRGGNVYDPADAIPAAARFLRALGARRNVSGALAAYNAGPGRADHPPAETRRYVRNVRAIARQYRQH